eukprot:309444-Pyramimonas_sp.AAC.1
MSYKRVCVFWRCRIPRSFLVVKPRRHSFPSCAKSGNGHSPLATVEQHILYIHTYKVCMYACPRASPSTSLVVDIAEAESMNTFSV